MATPRRGACKLVRQLPFPRRTGLLDVYPDSRHLLAKADALLRLSADDGSFTEVARPASGWFHRARLLGESVVWRRAEGRVEGPAEIATLAPGGTPVVLDRPASAASPFFAVDAASGRVAYSDGDRLVVRDAARGTELARIALLPSEMAGFAFAPGGSILALAEEGQVGLWTVPGGEAMRTLPATGLAIDLVFDARGEHLAGRSGFLGDCALDVWRVADGERVYASGKGGLGYSLALAAFRGRLLVTDGEKSIEARDFDTAAVIWTSRPIRSGKLSSLLPAPDGSALFASNRGGLGLFELAVSPE